VEGATTGGMRLFDAADPRPQMVSDAFGDIAGWSVLELGSLDGAHAYQLEQRGAHVIGIEANVATFQRLLAVKNALQLHAQFLLGDFLAFLQKTQMRFDLILASGVLYHIPDPIELLYQSALHSGRVFLWTHYLTPGASAAWGADAKRVYRRHGVECTYHRYDYVEDSSRQFSGTDSYCFRLLKDDIVAALRCFGLAKMEIRDDRGHRNGPAMSVVAYR
jgi:2-polyprenyl-3-methyl-5-hydroxy-6-metoxy-1,4-benzoquinol methylase